MIGKTRAFYAMRLSTCKPFNCGMLISDSGFKKAGRLSSNPKSAFRNHHGAGQFLATLYPAASASSTVLNLT